MCTNSVAVTPGTRLGPYEVLGSLGAGGMGEVYRARDTKLGRHVALKVLPPAFTADVNRVARFAREARPLASLNHPHIGTIYGFEGGGHVPALVLELGSLTIFWPGRAAAGGQNVRKRRYVAKFRRVCATSGSGWGWDRVGMIGGVNRGRVRAPFGVVAARLSRPALGAMQDPRDVDHITAHGVHHDVWQRRQHELARARFLPEPAAVWKCQQRGGCVMNRSYQRRSTVRRLFNEIIGDEFEIAGSCFGPTKLHQRRGGV